jgi:acetoin utilization protein AcuB
MKPNPVVVVCDTLVSEAKRLLAQNNLHVLPVMDGKQLRGLITRADCLRAAYFVSNTQSPEEFAYFTERLKVKDIMVRNPATIDASDTMDYCLEKGKELGVAQFPVVDKGEIVGIISANEIFALAAEFLSVWGKCKGLTLGPVVLKPGGIREITDIVTSAGADVQAIYPVGSTELPDFGEDKEKKVIVRFSGKEQSEVAEVLAAAGYKVHKPASEKISRLTQSA